MLVDSEHRFPDFISIWEPHNTCDFLLGAGIGS